VDFDDRGAKVVVERSVVVPVRPESDVLQAAVRAQAARIPGRQFDVEHPDEAAQLRVQPDAVQLLEGGVPLEVDESAHQAWDVQLPNLVGRQSLA
jgi:hypothetical protein